MSTRDEVLAGLECALTDMSDAIRTAERLDDAALLERVRDVEGELRELWLELLEGDTGAAPKPEAQPAAVLCRRCRLPPQAVCPAVQEPEPFGLACEPGEDTSR